MDILGGKFCVKCNNNDIRVLQFDHIYGGGRKERIKYKSNYQLITFYFHNPKEAKRKLQVLCANCNQIKKIENQEIHRRYR